MLGAKLNRSNQTSRSRTRASAPTKGVEQQPGNSFRYLYWRLAEKDFQRLCAALLRKSFDSVRCFPVGMADGGIDIKRGDIVYQVKWTSKFEKNPATWLKNTIDGERDNINALVKDKGVSRYILMTSVAGTSSANETGSIEKLQVALDAYSEEFEIPVECWWQADIDAEVDGADDSIKWSFPDMLAGVDAMRYLMYGSGVDEAASRTRETLRQVLATQWEADARVRFSQIELDGASLADLFVDVEAALVQSPTNAGYASGIERRLLNGSDKGAVEMLLETSVPLTFLLGVPGQGKSTLTQYLCQVHRAAILQGAESESEVKWPTAPIGEPKLPLRIELKDYAAWLDGADPFDDTAPMIRGRRRKRGARSAEAYIAELCVAASGGRAVTVEDVQRLLERYPCLIVFDGLDEVAAPDLRVVVVEEIENFASRLRHAQARLRSFQIVVTARPNATNLAEPGSERFQRLRLLPMGEALQADFVGKWCDARNLDGAPRQKLRRIFRDRTSLEHVSKLSDNPMQLAILLYLISKKGDAVPVARTPLYTDYMATLLDREVASQQIDRNAVPQVQEVTAFIGWYMHSGVEVQPAAGVMTKKDLETTFLLYLREVEANHEAAPELLRVATDRFWALTSETDGHFQFAVQPVREYFAARFLSEWGGRNLREPLSKQAVLVELMGRPYWLNTARFYAGFASPNELAALRYGVEEALADAENFIANRVAAWALLADAVFVGHSSAQKDVVRILTDDEMTLHLARERHYMSEFGRLTPDAGGTQLAEKLQTDVARDPIAYLAPARIDMLRDQSSLPRQDFDKWWTEQLDASIGTANEAVWLELGARYGMQHLRAETADRLNLGVTAVRRGALSVGAKVTSTDAARALLQCVLDGNTGDIRGRAVGEAGALQVAMRPHWFHHREGRTRDKPAFEETHSEIRELDINYRNSAWATLVKINPAYAELRAAARRGQRSQHGTTEPWQRPARELARIHGPSWLSAEIALAGAAAFGLLGSGSKDKGGLPFGDAVDYGTFVTAVRSRPNEQWWSETFDTFSDSLSRRTWMLALLSTATPETVRRHLERVDAIVASLTPDEYAATAASSSRLALNGTARSLSKEPPFSDQGLSARARLLLAHWQHERFYRADLEGLSDADLIGLALPDGASWPVGEALTARMLTSPSPALVAGLRNIGVDSFAGVKHMMFSEERGERVLSNRHDYPAEWVLRVYHGLHKMARPEPLGTVAQAKEWVPRVPRL